MFCISSALWSRRPGPHYAATLHNLIWKGHIAVINDQLLHQYKKLVILQPISRCQSTLFLHKLQLLICQQHTPNGRSRRCISVTSQITHKITINPGGFTLTICSVRGIYVNLNLYIFTLEFSVTTINIKKKILELMVHWSLQYDTLMNTTLQTVLPVRSLNINFKSIQFCYNADDWDDGRKWRAINYNWTLIALASNSGP
jgi:hypothetical protein